jgi:hypothetical protein
MSMENSTMRIVKFTDLPNFKVLFIEPLEEFGVKSIEDLTEVLKNDEKKASMISAVKGLGPKTVQAWENELVNHESPENNSVSGSQDALPEEDVADTKLEVTHDAPSEPEIAPSDETEILSTRPMAERNLFCTMDELKEIQRTAIDLLRMNGAKRKGQSESVDYVQKRLTDEGLEVSVNRESGFPTIVATNGEGGIVLWGHLDTERMKGMKRKEQGEILGDMKGAVASILCTVKRLMTWEAPFSIVLTTDALDDQLGAEWLSTNPLIKNSKGILLLGPTGMIPVIGHPGYAATKIRTCGEGSVMKMAAFLGDLDERSEDSSGRLSVKTGLIHGGDRKRPFESPLSCEVVVELETMDTTDSVTKMIGDLLVETDHEMEVMCQSEMTEFDRSSELALVMTELTRKEMKFQMSHSEAAKIVPVNDRIVIFGPGTMANSVTDQEYVTLNDLEWTFEIILNMVDRMNAPRDQTI